MPAGWFSLGEANLPPGWRLEHVTEIDSTNAELLRRLDAGTAVDRFSLVAGHQTAGRGRLDRRWDERPGEALLISTVFGDPPDPPSLLGRAAGLAVLDVAGPAAALKWPNDVVVGGRKLAGILAQRASGGEVVVGVGLNVLGGPDGAAALCELVVETPSLPAVAVDYLCALDRHLADPTSVPDRHRARLSTLGRAVRVSLPGDRVLSGVAVAVDDDGRLLVEADDGETHTLDAGDVVHLRPG